jgi:hypothetical protein
MQPLTRAQKSFPHTIVSTNLIMHFLSLGATLSSLFQGDPKPFILRGGKGESPFFIIQKRGAMYFRGLYGSTNPHHAIPRINLTSAFPRHEERRIALPRKTSRTRSSCTTKPRIAPRLVSRSSKPRERSNVSKEHAS